MEVTIKVCGTDIKLSVLRRKSTINCVYPRLHWAYTILAEFEGRKIKYTYHSSEIDYINNWYMKPSELINSFYAFLTDALDFCEYPDKEQFFKMFGYEISGSKAGNWVFRNCEKSYKDLRFSTDRLCQWINDMADTYNY